MKRYIAIDPGKFATKIAEYFPAQEMIKKFAIRTRVSKKADMRDDAIEEKTVIVEIDGVTYKVGNGASGGKDVALETTKMSEEHKICAITAIACSASAKEDDEIVVAVGLPTSEWANVSKREEYRDYILPEGKMTVSVKLTSDSPVIKKTFTIIRKYIFPESIGGLMMDETVKFIADSMSVTGVLDLGNLNLNATMWQGKELLQDRSITAELGGANLITKIASELSTEISRIDELIVANILKQSAEDREIPNNGNLSAEQVERSREIIAGIIRNHAEEIKNCCNSKKWSLDTMNIVAIGGTSYDIQDDLRAVFGNVTILPETKYCNVLGFLRLMCARSNELNKMIPLNFVEKESA